MEYDFKTFQFGYGNHDTREAGMCLMECVAYLGGEPHSDQPRCASPVLTVMGIELNDSYQDAPEDNAARQLALADLPWRLVGTRADEAVEFARLQRLAAWLQPRVEQLLRQQYPQNYQARLELGRIMERLITPGEVATELSVKAAARLTNDASPGLRLLGLQAQTTLDSLLPPGQLASRATFLVLLWWHYKNLLFDAGPEALRPEQQAFRDLLIELIQLTEPQEAACQPRCAALR